MRALIIIIAIFLFPLFVYAQADTLMLVEENSIEVPSGINKFYIEDMSDSTKAIFIKTNNHVYAYNSPDFNLLWSSPELINPRDLRFTDINNDGLTDIAIRDSLHIYLYDVANSDLIWTSPNLDSTCSDYILGDRNADSFSDLVILTRTVNDFYVFYDTVSLLVYDGPEFTRSDSTGIIMGSGWNPEYPYSYISENVGRSTINYLTYIGTLHPYIFIFTYFYYSEIEFDHSSYATGRLWIIDGLNLDTIRNGENSGYLIDGSTVTESDSTYFVGLTGFFSEWNENWEQHHVLTIENISRDLSYSIVLWRNDLYYYQGYGWKNAFIQFVDPFYQLCFAYQDTVSLLSFPDLDPIITISDVADLDSAIGIYKSEAIFNDYQVMCKFDDPVYRYKFYSDTDGSLQAVLNSQNRLISKFEDINSDGNDEMFSVTGNTLHIYRLDYYVGINPPQNEPKAIHLSQNYPNPFNISTMIKYELPKESQVTIDIYDILGRKVSTLTDALQPAGYHEFIWNAESLSSGVYFYKLQAGGYSETRKMMLVK